MRGRSGECLMVHRARDDHALRMNAIYEHPSLKMHVTTEQRDRAESWLKEAYADGRISELEFDQRIGQVLSAVSRKDLNEAFYGLVQVPTPSRALGVHPAYQPLVRPDTRQQAGRGVAGFAHFSFFFMWLFAVNGVAYVAYTLFSGEWRELVPNRHTLRDAWNVMLHDLHIRRRGRNACADCRTHPQRGCQSNRLAGHQRTAPRYGL